ncbi:MAG: hypothetical protein ACK5HR_01465 [Mycoplasmatales bacterium]
MDKKLIEEYKLIADISQKINLLEDDLKNILNDLNLNTNTKYKLKELLNEWEKDIHNYKVFQRQDLEFENKINIYFDNNNIYYDNYNEKSTP